MLSSARPAAPAVVILGTGSLPVARRLRDTLPGAEIFGLTSRVSAEDVIPCESFGDTLRLLFGRDRPVIALCAAGIVIRALAPLLGNKRAEPPVLAVAEDGSAVVPLLGGLRGVNALARQMAAALDCPAAITTSGELRFTLTLEQLPPGFRAANPQDSKRFMSDLLAGVGVRLDGHTDWGADWLADSRLTDDPDGPLRLTVSPEARAPAPDELLIRPQVVAVAVTAASAASARAVLARRGLSEQAVACVLTPPEDAGAAEVLALAAALDCPQRVLPAGLTADSLGDGLTRHHDDGVSLLIGSTPRAVQSLGQPRGSVTVVGTGPGSREWMTPAVKAALTAATDVIGYQFYVDLAGPYRPDQALHTSDNRVELDRARHAFSLAASGRQVVVVSSGDGGIFAMAAAVLEALEDSADPAWHAVALRIEPGVTAAQAAAARAGAALGHDFCVISLSDNLKPWPVIVTRLDHAAAADLVMAFYNPISKARPWQLAEAFDTVRRHRSPETPVLLGRDIGRPAETVTVTTLGAVTPDQVDMRTVVIVGSSHSRTFPRADGGRWLYAPRWYGEKPVK
ncbi:precorrin-3B C(17)-methyltransferase [Novispirillum itersonii]|uniref:Cobalt-precorrin 5A hydrolase/precorrin-3B C17-methyltransferase n=1 Tax=Novispirillum itersonii TaxID=189 RepID=A0A7W9ZCD6_NOVIT|nr:precorrin-3B C(17)-methyltransferase [Novispirillum itersonii]MBB6208883.1 cobalt-precorrin 5A hydrolase/precorrin-3B C17-methyltransferase [Novispirillum itersonii]